LIEIRPFRRGWKVFEAPGVEPVFLTKGQAINCFENRASFRSGEIRISNSYGDVDRIVPFTESDRKLVTRTRASQVDLNRSDESSFKNQAARRDK
jgi:hypothetical protein